MRGRAALGALVTLGVVLGQARGARAGATPHLSERWLPSSNGLGAVAWDREAHKLVQFLEHPYAAATAGAQTRNFLFDSYPGVRVGGNGGTGTWLDGVAPVLTEYVPGTGIVHARRSLSGLQLDEYDFTPMGLAEYASVMLVEVTQTGNAGPVDVYSLFNYHLGTGAPSPGADSETLTYDATRDAFYEAGPSLVAMAYASVTPSTHHGCTPNNPFGLLNAGANLADDPGTGGPTTDAVPGFQTSLGTLAANAKGWAGWLTVLAPDADGASAVDRVRTWVNGRSPATLLSDEIAGWKAWTKPPPNGASASEAAVALQAQVVLRLGQVQEKGPGKGQILASVAPGQWNIAWVRDMAYATVGLVRSGHLAEAKAAIAFQLGASVGAFQQEVGAPYQISVVRYYGDGTEWSDSNADGPNIEFDGFGLFLWELDEYVHASGDAASLATWWPAVKGKVADVLVSLQEASGLIKPDSSIWEVHWNGQQKHFAYTTITAASGLCAASRLAKTAGDAASAAAYLTAGQSARDALLPNLRAPDGTLVQSTEALAAGVGVLDAAVIEALDLGLVDPTRHTATATLASLENGLVPQSGHGFMRSDVGDAYSSNEWVFVDLRAARALELHGDAAASASLFAWNVAQASDNFGELSELHDPVTADYAGQAPMVGFGAGAYLLRLSDRGRPPSPACEAFAAEPANPSDAGPDGEADGGTGATTGAGAGGSTASGATTTGTGAGGSPDGGSTTTTSGGYGGAVNKVTPAPASSGCGCTVAPATDRAMKKLRGLAAVLALGGLFGACSAAPAASSSAATSGAGGSMTTTGLAGSTGPTTTGPGGGSAGSAGPGGNGSGGMDAGIDASVSKAPCSTTFRFVPPAGTLAKVVSVSGEWNTFADPGVPMTGPDASGAFTAQVPLTPGFYAYKLIVDGQWQLDPKERWQKYAGGIANSGVQVTDCHAPTLALATNAVARPAAGQGHYTASVTFVPGEGAPPLEPSTVQATLRKDGQTSPLAGATVSAAGSSIVLSVPKLADGKYSAFVTAKDYAGQSTQALRLVFWVEAEAFEWSDSLIYMAMTDRFKDGDPSNDPPPTTKGPNNTSVTVDAREDYHGGDLQGVTQKIADGTLDQVGARVLWLSPFNTNPSDAWPASDGVHFTTGYHGYWPIKAREVDPRFGGEKALHALVTAAHAHGIRVIMDTVVQHVHQEHEYLAAHPDWFNTTGCICGTNNCDWTVHRLDCLFTSYMPNIDWTSTAGTQQWEADAIWWLDTFDLDGFRMDAVKQVPDAAVINLSSAVRGEFEASGTHVYMVGETAMGWVDNTLSDDLSQYQLINEYVDDGLDGQFDFPLYYAVPMNVFANQSYGLDHADYWAQASGWEYRPGSIMSPFIGSEDTARFITIASYRGQTPALDPGIPYNQWANTAGPPPDSETYGRHRLALAWLLGLPGAPLVYYGDEYGQYGGVDPNNRMDWRGDSGNLSSDEQATLAFVRKVGQARRALPAMRRGAYVPVYNTDADVLVFARQDGQGHVALEALSRLDGPTSVTTALPASLAIADGTVLHDQMGGPDVPVSGGTITVSLGGQGVAILAP